jgi:hypothetical protein
VTIEVAKAKEVVLLVLERSRDVEAYEGTIFKRDGFEKIVRAIEDRDPHWLVEHLRDPKYDKTTRAQVATYMQGVNANMLLLELMSD